MREKRGRVRGGKRGNQRVPTTRLLQSSETSPLEQLEQYARKLLETKNLRSLPRFKKVVENLLGHYQSLALKSTWFRTLYGLNRDLFFQIKHKLMSDEVTLLIKTAEEQTNSKYGIDPKYICQLKLEEVSTHIVLLTNWIDFLRHNKLDVFSASLDRVFKFSESEKEDQQTRVLAYSFPPNQTLFLQEVLTYSEINNDTVNFFFQAILNYISFDFFISLFNSPNALGESGKDIFINRNFELNEKTKKKLSEKTIFSEGIDILNLHDESSWKFSSYEITTIEKVESTEDIADKNFVLIPVEQAYLEQLYYFISPSSHGKTPLHNKAEKFLIEPSFEKSIKLFKELSDIHRVFLTQNPSEEEAQRVYLSPEGCVPFFVLLDKEDVSFEDSGDDGSRCLVLAELIGPWCLTARNHDGFNLLNLLMLSNKPKRFKEFSLIFREMLPDSILEEHLMCPNPTRRNSYISPFEMILKSKEKNKWDFNSFWRNFSLPYLKLLYPKFCYDLFAGHKEFSKASSILSLHEIKNILLEHDESTLQLLENLLDIDYVDENGKNTLKILLDEPSYNKNLELFLLLLIKLNYFWEIIGVVEENCVKLLISYTDALNGIVSYETQKKLPVRPAYHEVISEIPNLINGWAEGIKAQMIEGSLPSLKALKQLIHLGTPSLLEEELNVALLPKEPSATLQSVKSNFCSEQYQKKEPCPNFFPSYLPNPNKRKNQPRDSSSEIETQNKTLSPPNYKVLLESSCFDFSENVLFNFLENSTNCYVIVPPTKYIEELTFDSKINKTPEEIRAHLLSGNLYFSPQSVKRLQGSGKIVQYHSSVLGIEGTGAVEYEIKLNNGHGRVLCMTMHGEINGQPAIFYCPIKISPLHKKSDKKTLSIPENICISRIISQNPETEDKETLKL